MLKLYNSLSKQIEGIPKKSHLNMYSCGPTVYNYAHIGNLRSFIMADLLYRTLKYDGYNPQWAMNITDIDDKTIKGTIEKYGQEATVENLREFTQSYLDAFLADLKEVNIVGSDDFNLYKSGQKLDFSKKLNFIRVTDVIPQIQEFILNLLDKNYAYKADDGSVYFSIESYQKDFGDYGELVGEKFLQGKKIGARVKVDEYEKDNLSDFALWKAWDENDAQIFWEHKLLGKGRPGWHIECSVINHIAFNGEPTDIHTGGVDLIFPHHTNEIAQSQALLGKGNFVKHWFHSEHLLVEGKKMAKSAGNFYTLKDLTAKGFLGQDFRYLIFSSSYRNQQNFTMDSLEAAHNALQSFADYIGNLLKKYPDSLKLSFTLAGKDGSTPEYDLFFKDINNDLNIPSALARIWELVADKAFGDKVKLLNLLNFGQFLGLNIETIPHSRAYTLDVESGKYSLKGGEVKLSVKRGTSSEEKNDMLVKEASKLLEERQQARDSKDFAKSDELRKQIEALGYEVMDTPEGQKIKKKLQI